MSLFRVPEDRITYSSPPADARRYTDTLDQSYTRFARLYDIALKTLPVWKTWIATVVPWIERGPVLEVSCGPGWLMTRYAARFESYGADYNARMIDVAADNLRARHIDAALIRADAGALPFADECFGTIVNTMAFTGYPDGHRVLSEFFRILQPQGTLLLVDFDFPADRNRFGYALTRLMERAGDTIKDIGAMLDQRRFEFVEEEIGGFGAVHFYRAKKT